MAQNGSKVLQGIAIRLSWDLHSGAKENIISSLLSASINDSARFQEWLLDEIGYDKENRKGLYSEPNHDIGDITGTIKRTIPNYNTKRLPRRPDVLIYSSDCEEGRRKLREIGSKRWLSTDDKRELARTLNRIRVVFVEVKHTALSNGDERKYGNLINGLSRYQETGRLGDTHRFVILSAHTEKAKERIVAKVASEEQTTKEEERWHRLFGRREAGVTHITLEYLYRRIRKNHSMWCDGCPILQLFEYYLALHLGIFDNIGFHEEYWRQVIKGDDSPYGLKWSIADHISWLASNASVKLVRGSRFDTDRTDELAEIEFRPYNGHGRLVKFIHKQQCEDLRIIIGKKVHHLRTGDLKKKEGIGELVKVLSAVSKYID